MYIINFDYYSRVISDSAERTPDGVGGQVSSPGGRDQGRPARRWRDNGGENVGEVTKKKAETTEIFQDATFNLHKWHSNVAELEDVPQNDQRNNTGQPDTTSQRNSLGRTDRDQRYLVCLGISRKIRWVSLCLKNEAWQPPREEP